MKTALIIAGVLLMAASGVRAQHAGQPQGGHTPDHMEHSFADVEQYAKAFEDPARDAWQMPDRVIAALGLKAGQSVADIGAGTGYFSIRLAKSAAAPKVFAVDIEANMVQHLQHRAIQEGLKNITAVKADAASPNLPEAVDAILIVDTYHHIGNRVAYFTALKAKMKPGAKLAIVDFRKDAAGDGPPKEYRFTPDQVSAELAQAGFALQAQHDFLPRQMYVIYTAK